MKNIAVLLYDVTIEYHYTLINGILSFFKDKVDANVFIAPVNVPHVVSFESNYQYWTTVEVLKTKSIDSVIVIPNSFARDLSVDQLANELQRMLPKPVISVSVPLNLSTNSYTAINPKNAYLQVVEHLVKKHNRKKIAFFSASLVHAVESDERENAYKAALKKFGLEFHKEWVFPGDYTPANAHKYIVQTYSSKEDVPFDAILCANDYTAQGAIRGLEDIGVKVPEDVSVVGFDNSDISRSNRPTISTIDQHLVMSGYKAAELAYKAAFGKRVPKKVMVDCLPVFRQSCCKQLEDILLPESQNYFIVGKTDPDSLLNLFGNALNDLSVIYNILNMSDAVINLKDYFNSLKKAMQKMFTGFMAICLYSHEITLEPDDDFVLPKKARLIMLIDDTRDIEMDYSAGGGILFNPSETILPIDFEDMRRRDYFVFPVALGKVNYGYAVSEISNEKYTIHEIYMKILMNSLVHALEYSKIENQNEKLEETNLDLSFKSTTDELTGLYNRRGFMNFAQKSLDLAAVTKKTGAIFFFDMDGLKDINDTWGHKAGDLAIQSTGEVLKEAFHKSDLIGHLSGDEFVVLAMGFSKENIEKFRERINILFGQKRYEKNLPFELSASLGVAEYDAEHTDLQSLLIEADQEMYKEKKIKHAARKK